MPLTADQKAKIKQILAAHRRDVRTLVKKHKQEIVKTVEELDAVKTKKIKRIIESA
jgi:hypothetical protein